MNKFSKPTKHGIREEMLAEGLNPRTPEWRSIYIKRWQVKFRPARTEYCTQWQRDNVEACRKRAREHYHKNKERIRAAQKARYYEKRQSALSNPRF